MPRHFLITPRILVYSRVVGHQMGVFSVKLHDLLLLKCPITVFILNNIIQLVTNFLYLQLLIF